MPRDHGVIVDDFTGTGGGPRSKLQRLYAPPARVSFSSRETPCPCPLVRCPPMRQSQNTVRLRPSSPEPLSSLRTTIVDVRSDAPLPCAFCALVILRGLFSKTGGEAFSCAIAATPGRFGKASP